MKTLKKRVFSLALALVMVLSLLPSVTMAMEQETLKLGSTFTTSDAEGTGLPTNIPENSHWVLTGERSDTAASPVCGAEAHTHTDDCVTAISQEAYDSSDPACFIGSHTVYWKNVQTCTQSEHTHDRDCYGKWFWVQNFDGEIAHDGDTAISHVTGAPIMYKVFYWTDIFGFQYVDPSKTGWYYLTCTRTEHTHTEDCFSVQPGTAEDHNSTEKVTDYYRYTCGKAVHTHTEACYPMAYDWVLKSKYTENSQKLLETLSDGKVSFGVFRLYKNEVPEDINQPFGNSLFGPSGNGTPYFTVTVDMAKLLAKDGMEVYWNGDSWYVSLDSCLTPTVDQFWANLEDCMSKDDLAKFQEAFGGLYRAYVIKHDPDQHMDGVMTLEPPTYTVELYDGETLCHTNTLSKTPHTLSYVKSAYETYLANTYGQGVMDWTANTYTATQGTDDTADDVVYTVSIQTWPEENGAVKYIATSDAKDFNLAVFKLQVRASGSLTIEKAFSGDLTSAPSGFDATFTVQRGGETVATFTWAQVRDGEAVLRNLPYGGVYTVTESVTGGASFSGTLSGKEGTFTHTDTAYSQEEVTIGNSNTTVTVTNTYTFTEAGKATVRYAWDTVNGVAWPETAGTDPMEALTGETFYVKDGAPAMETVPDVTDLGPGYAVDGWYLSQDQGAGKAAQADLDALTDGQVLTLYARLTTKSTGYQVRYDYWLSTNGGEAVHVAYGDYRSASSTSEPKKEDVFNSVSSPVTYQGTSYAKKDAEDLAAKQAEVTLDGGSWANQDLKFTVKVYGTTYTQGALTIQKTVTGLTAADTLALRKTLVFRIYDDSDTQVGGDIPYSAFTSGKYTLSGDLPLGTYTVKESGGNVTGYTWNNEETATETGYSVTVSGASATCAITNAYEGKTYTVCFDAGEHGTMNNGGVTYRWFGFSDGTYEWIRNTRAAKTGENQVRFSVTWEDLRNGAEATEPTVTADEGYTFGQKWTDGDGVQFADLKASLEAMDKAGVTEITYYADYTADESGNQPGSEPGSEPGNQPGSEPGNQPGSEPGSEPGNEPGSEPGNEPGNEPGSEPGNEPGSEPGNEPGNETGSETGSASGSRDDDDDDDDDDAAVTEVLEEDVPLTDLPQLPDVPAAEPAEEPALEIADEDVPMAEAPETGDATALLALMTTASGSGLAWLAISGKKRREEEN